MNRKTLNSLSKKQKIALIVFSAIGFVVAYSLSSSLFSTSVEDEIGKIAVEMSKSCPKMMDEFTRLDSVVSPKNSRNIKYCYTLSGINEDSLDLNAVHSNLREVIITGIKTSKDMKYLKKHDVVFDYLYFGKNKKKLMEIKILPTEYKE
ncbi:hypothetical protein [Bacteroides sp. 224]|uniref:hypothetical protein n=1 Tax=Bacteroides sp. 224 TaxID=2302936 RepID=UPI0013D7BD6C|nr:hypothetical protein [Bacteroides sp. 224]